MHAFPPVVTPYLPLIYVHITAGVIAIIAGYVAVIAKKGERLHRAFGTVFALAILTLAVMAIYLAISLLHALPGQMGNVAAGIFTLYFVSTSWMTVRRKEGTIGLFEKVALVAVLGRCGDILVLERTGDDEFDGRSMDIKPCSIMSFAPSLCSSRLSTSR